MSSRFKRYGYGDTTLNVIKKGFKNLNNGTVVWSQNSTLEDTWHPAAISLPFESSSPNFVLIFEGIVGTRVYGDIAIGMNKRMNLRIEPIRS